LLGFTGACARNSVQDGLGKNGTDTALAKSIALCAMHMMCMCFQYVPNDDCRIYHYKRLHDTTSILTQLSILYVGVIGNCMVACRHIGVGTRLIIDLPAHDFGWSAQVSACVGYHTNTHECPKMLIVGGSQASDMLLTSFDKFPTNCLLASYMLPTGFQVAPRKVPWRVFLGLPVRDYRHM